MVRIKCWLHVITNMSGRRDRVVYLLFKRQFSRLMVMLVGMALMVVEIAVIVVVYLDKPDLTDEQTAQALAVFGLSVGALITIVFQLIGMFLSKQDKDDIIEKIDKDGKLTRQTITDKLAVTNQKLDDIYNLLDKRLPGGGGT